MCEFLARCRVHSTTDVVRQIPECHTCHVPTLVFNISLDACVCSVRNIPFSMTEAKLRSLAVKAVKERASKEKPEIKQV